MQDFRKLLVWQKARDLVADVYRFSGRFPKEELYGLTSQVRRAAVSIAANIAEGRGSGTDKAFGRYLHLAMGSAYELECHLIIAGDLGFIPTEAVERLAGSIAEVRKMINALIQTLRSTDQGEDQGSRTIQANG